MGSVRRIYVEKKKAFAVKAKELQEDIGSFLGIGVEDVRVFIRYENRISLSTASEVIPMVWAEISSPSSTNMICRAMPLQSSQENSP